MERFQTAKVTF